MKKLRLTDHDREKMKQYREILNNSNLNLKAQKIVIGSDGGCGEQCMITCAFYCKDNCEDTCKNTCLGSCKDTCNIACSTYLDMFCTDFMQVVSIY